MNDINLPEQPNHTDQESAIGEKKGVVMVEEKQTDSEAVQGVSQSVTSAKEFTPNLDMMKWVDTAIQLETDTISDIAEACGIDRKQWYRWLDRPGFIDWFRGEWNRKLQAHSWKLDAIGMKRAKVDHKYWHDMQNRVGNLIDKPSTLQQFNVSGEMKVEFTE